MKNFIRTFLFFSFFAMASALQAAPTVKFEVTGLTEKPLENVQTRLSIEKNNLDSLTASSIRTFFQQSPKMIQNALEPFGYFHSRIASKKLTYAKNTWTAHYTIKPGPTLSITSINLHVIGPGQSNTHILNTIQKPPLKPGDPFNVPNYENLRNHLLSAAQHQGYIKAHMQIDKVLINLNNNTCVINLTMDTGMRYFFGHTTFSPNPLSETLLRRYLDYQPGSHFSAKKLIALQNTLNSSGYYKNVEVTPHLQKIQNYRVPVDIKLTPQTRKMYQFGLGYGSVSGARISGNVLWRWVNRFGHKFDTSFNLSTVNKTLQAQYLIPGRNPAKNQYSINAGMATLNPRHGTAFLQKVGAGYLSKYGRLQTNFNVSYLLERYKVDGEGGTRNANVLLPSFTINWISTDDPLTVKNGAQLYFIIQGAHKNLASSVSFLQGEFRAKTVNTLWEDNRFILQADVGYTVVENAENLPLSLRYYTGGPTSIRGYAIQSIGPGRYTAVASAEYQRRVYGNFYAAIFYDAGNAMNSFDNFSSELKRSTGLGVVYQSPIGNISLYLAKALTSKGQPIRFEFSIGPML